jgi:hypothetical protein
MPQQSFRFLDPDSPRRAPNYGSRKVQIKLMMLVGSLFAVVWCMQYAGKPETWQWLMQMDKDAKVDGPAPGSNSAAEPKSPALDAISTKPQETDPVWPNPYATASNVSQLPLALEAVYWRTALDRLTPDEKFVFVDAVHQWSTDLAPNISNDPVLRSALTKLTNLRQRLDQQLNSAALLNGPDLATETTEADLAPPDSATTTEDIEQDDNDADDDTQPSDELPSLNPSSMVRALFELPNSIDMAEVQAITDHSRWLASYWTPLIQSDEYAESSASPGVSGETLRLSEALANREHWKLLESKFLDPHLLRTIADGSRLGRPNERAAWLRFVQKVAPQPSTDSPTESSERITRQNLLGQPDEFRGRKVQLTGTIRRVELIRQTDPVVAKSMPATEYVVVWLQPAVSGQGPYCVYCTHDDVLKQLAKSDPDPRRLAKVEARFFKLYPYTTNQGKTAVCPLLVTDAINLQEVRPEIPNTSLGTGEWAMIIGGISLLAVGLATAGWYSTRYRSANPLGARKREAAQVDWLDQTQVPSTGESLRELAANEQSRENSHERT